MDTTERDIDLYIKKVQDTFSKDYFSHENLEQKNITNEVGYLIRDNHFVNGPNLHSYQYYYAKQYFLSSINCGMMAEILAQKIEELNLNKDTTLVGFRGYMGPLLYKTCNKLKELNYIIIEHDKEKFILQSPIDKSKIKKNLIIILPITCTCSTYIRIRKYLQEQIRKYKKNNIIENFDNYDLTICDKFITIFSILDESLNKNKENIIINKKKQSNVEKTNQEQTEIIREKLEKLYLSFNWDYVDEEKIVFNVNAAKSKKYIAYTIVRLFSGLYLTEECPFCFPKDDELIKERYIFPTNIEFETPNLIFGFPNFNKKKEKQENKTNNQKFNEIFETKDLLGTSHLYGHTVYDGNSYLNFIRGNAFYQNNKNYITEFFIRKISEIWEKNKKIKNEIVFITSENKFNSSFLDEFCSSKIFKNISTNILRFDNRNEFLDNFMSTNNQLLLRNDVLLIYYTDVLAIGRNLKLLNTYIKQYRIDKTDNIKHGFDYVFTLIDRSAFYTKRELESRLSLDEEKRKSCNIISYFELNVPVFTASHLGNPLKENFEHLIKMIHDSNLDSIKSRIGYELPERIGTPLSNESDKQPIQQRIRYYPFEDINGRIFEEMLLECDEKKIKGKMDLLKLYIMHEIISIIPELKSKCQSKTNPEELIVQLINKVNDKIIINNESFFIDNIEKLTTSHSQIKEISKEIITEKLIKIISRKPFTYFKDIIESIFKYSIIEIDDFINKINNGNGVLCFKDLRKFKFLIRRLVELNSNYLFSHKFFYFIKTKFEHNLIGQPNKNNTLLNNLLFEYKEIIRKKGRFDTKEKLKYYDALIRSFSYKYNQTNSMVSFIIYSYKELINQNPARSIKLEGLLNHKHLMPEEVKNSQNEDLSVIKLIKNPYYNFMAMMKCENIHLLKALKELHKRNYRKYSQLIKNIEINKNVIDVKKIQDSLESWPKWESTSSIVNYYFKHFKSDPIILNARKFLKESRHYNEDGKYFDCIKKSIGKMLQASTIFSDDEEKYKKKNEKTHDFLTEIDAVLKSVVGVLQPGVENDDIPVGTMASKIKYALCVKYRDKTSKDEKTDNIYTISSHKIHQTIELNKNGLIYNILEGLFEVNELESNNLKEEQSLIAAVRDNDKYYAYSEMYFMKENNKTIEKSFNELLYADKYQSSTKIGLEILENANLCLFIRLSTLNIPELNEGICEINGNAVLVITCANNTNVPNYLNFINFEKVRLLLLLKDEFLNFIKRKFKSDAFIELIKNKDRMEFTNKMEHMVDKYFKAMEYILEKKILDHRNVTLLKFLKEKIHVHYRQISDHSSEQLEGISYEQYEYSEKHIEELFNLIMEVPYLAPITLYPEDYLLDCKIKKFTCNEIIYEQVIPEIMINMRRYTQYNTLPVRFTIKYVDDKLIFQNIYDREYNSEPTTHKENGGKHMCKILCEQHGVIFIEKDDKENNMIIIELKFN